MKAQILKIYSILFLFLSIFFSSLSAYAVFTELGVNYAERMTYFDANNNIKTKSTTASLSFYIWEKLGLELSYTNGIMERYESYTSNSILVNSTITQYQSITGSDLILSFADRRAFFQPYIKGGMAYIKKRQVVTDNYGSSSVELAPGTVPSLGAGFKFMLTEAFGLKFSYDQWATPNQSLSIKDTAMRVGLTWVF
jgi:hypothetical protein